MQRNNRSHSVFCHSVVDTFLNRVPQGETYELRTIKRALFHGYFIYYFKMDPSTMTGDEIVITGISGKFPNSENVNIFQKNLLDMVDCITDENPRWSLGKLKR